MRLSYYDVLHIFLIQHNVHLIHIQFLMDENNMKRIIFKESFETIAVSPRLYLGKTPKYIWQLTLAFFIFLSFVSPPPPHVAERAFAIDFGYRTALALHVHTVCDVPLCRVPVISFSPTSL